MLPVAPIFETGIDFGVFYPKIWVLSVGVLILNSSARY
jgi:hypothetical protein